MPGFLRPVALPRWRVEQSRRYVATRDDRLDVVVRWALGSGSATVAGCAAVAAACGLAATGAGVATLWIVCGGAVAGVAVCVAISASLPGWQATMCAFVADIGIAVGLTALEDRRLMFAGCVLFATVSGFAAIAVPVGGLAMHTVFVAAFTVNAAVLMTIVERVSSAIAVMGAAIWLWVLVGAALAVRRIWVDTSAAAALASYDPLTGLLNRAGMEQAFAELAKSAASLDATMMVIVIDIDDFKSVNDRYGHQVGDAVIVEAGQVLIRHYRRLAAVARTGGEEYTAIIIGNSDYLTEVVASTPTATLGVQGPAVTFSVGAVRCNYLGEHHPFRQATAAADHAMYTAKNRGGNTIHIGITTHGTPPAN